MFYSKTTWFPVGFMRPRHTCSGPLQGMARARCWQRALATLGELLQRGRGSGGDGGNIRSMSTPELMGYDGISEAINYYFNGKYPWILIQPVRWLKHGFWWETSPISYKVYISWQWESYLGWQRGYPVDGSWSNMSPTMSIAVLPMEHCHL